MKKGISLIVLVITILVMIILAGAIIITLSNQNIIGKTNYATAGQNAGNMQDEVTLAYVNFKAENPNSADSDFTYDDTTLQPGYTRTGTTVQYTGPAIAGAPTASADWPSWYNPAS